MIGQYGKFICGNCFSRYYAPQSLSSAAAKVVNAWRCVIVADISGFGD
jgi:hypothetical protein